MNHQPVADSVVPVSVRKKIIDENLLNCRKKDGYSKRKSERQEGIFQ